jgi:FMN phosphatase YigB (HAD superfamily)
VKFLTNQINWDKITHIGFDLDGTLYDEFEFISQAYDDVLVSWGIRSADELLMARNFMRSRWIEKGSSYPRIFGETIELLKLDHLPENELINLALKAYRDCIPDLSISPRVKYLLSTLSEKFFLFMVTDGQSNLQRNKIKALGLDIFFEGNQIYISGDFGSEFHKPSSLILNKFNFNLQLINCEQIIYIGDRFKDKEFAKKGNMQFCFIDQLFHQL